MPTLKQLECSVELGPKTIRMSEYGTTYGDGCVQTYVAVPQIDCNLAIRLTSSGYIAPGLSMFVFIDGVPQCNRNRTGLVTPDAGIEPWQYEVDFRVRDKEDKLVDTKFLARSWSFQHLHLVDGHTSRKTEENFGNLGTIEVVVLRCDVSDGMYFIPPKTSSEPSEHWWQPVVHPKTGHVLRPYDMESAIDDDSDIGNTAQTSIDQLDGASDDPQIARRFLTRNDDRRQFYYDDPDLQMLSQINGNDDRDIDRRSRQSSTGRRSGRYPVIDSPTQEIMRENLNNRPQGFVNEAFRRHGISPSEGRDRLDPIYERGHKNYETRSRHQRYSSPPPNRTRYQDRDFQPSEPELKRNRSADLNDGRRGYGEFNREPYSYGFYSHVPPYKPHFYDPIAYTPPSPVRYNPQRAHRIIPEPHFEDDSILGNMTPLLSRSGDNTLRLDAGGMPYTGRDDSSPYYRSMSPVNRQQKGTVEPGWHREGRSDVGHGDHSPRDRRESPRKPKSRFDRDEPAWNDESSRKPKSRFDRDEAAWNDESSRRNKSRFDRDEPAWNDESSRRNKSRFDRDETTGSDNSWKARYSPPGRHLSPARSKSSPTGSYPWACRDSDDGKKTHTWRESGEKNDDAEKGGWTSPGPSEKNSSAGHSKKSSTKAGKNEKSTWSAPWNLPGDGYTSDKNDKNDWSWKGGNEKKKDNDWKEQDEGKQKTKSKSKFSSAAAPFDPSISQVKPYWAKWKRDAYSPSPRTMQPQVPGPGQMKSPYVTTAEPLTAVPRLTAENLQISHQIQVGRAVLTAHKTANPEYLDSLEQPYAVFVFKYRSKEMLEKIIPGVEVKEDKESYRERLNNLSKNDIIDQLMVVKKAAGYRTDSSPDESDSGSDDESAQSKKGAETNAKDDKRANDEKQKDSWAWGKTSNAGSESSTIRKENVWSGSGKGNSWGRASKGTAPGFKEGWGGMKGKKWTSSPKGSVAASKKSKKWDWNKESDAWRDGKKKDDSRDSSKKKDDSWDGGKKKDGSWDGGMFGNLDTDW